MPTFYFHFRGRHTEIPDLIGKDCPDVQAARERAVQHARDILVDEILIGRVGLEDCIEVEDEDLRPVFVLPFSEALDAVARE